MSKPSAPKFGDRTTVTFPRIISSRRCLRRHCDDIPVRAFAAFGQQRRRKCSTGPPVTVGQEAKTGDGRTADASRRGPRAAPACPLCPLRWLRREAAIESITTLPLPASHRRHDELSRQCHRSRAPQCSTLPRRPAGEFRSFSARDPFTISLGSRPIARERPSPPAVRAIARSPCCAAGRPAGQPAVSRI